MNVSNNSDAFEQLASNSMTLKHLNDRRALFQSVKVIAQTYGRYHGYISTLICIFGIFANAMMIAVLIRPAMRTSVNALLASIAAAHGLTMLTYLTFTLHDLLIDFCDIKAHFSYSWQVFLTLHADLSVVFHSISLWLTVFLAVVRFMVLRKPMIAMTWNSMRAGCSITFCTSLAVTLFCFLNIFRNTVQPYAYYSFGSCGGVQWNASLSNLSLYRITPPYWWNDQLEHLNFWFVGIFMKVLPCFLMAIFIALLIHVLVRARTRQLRLSAKTSTVHESTSVLLLLIVFVFWLTQLPQGMMTVASAFDPFVFELYRTLGDILDLLSLINSCVSFPIYCAMSQKFRAQFAAVFGLYRMQCCTQWRPQYDGLPQFENSTVTYLNHLNNRTVSNTGQSQRWSSSYDQNDNGNVSSRLSLDRWLINHLKPGRIMKRKDLTSTTTTESGWNATATVI